MRFCYRSTPMRDRVKETNVKKKDEGNIITSVDTVSKTETQTKMRKDLGLSRTSQPSKEKINE